MRVTHLKWFVRMLLGRLRKGTRLTSVYPLASVSLTQVLSMSAASAPTVQALQHLKFDNSAARELPLDSITENFVRTVPNAIYSKSAPTPLKDVSLASISASAWKDAFGADVENWRDWTDDEKKEVAKYFSGNELLPGSEPLCHCYCGHQFGSFAGQLGDGRAHSLGEIVNTSGARWEIQLKGSGLTPYSRHADGRAVLRSSIREFLCSEYMHALGIPTTRAGTLTVADETVPRDILYNGNVREEQCAVVSRLAPSFLRFGSFEITKTKDVQTGRMVPSIGRTDLTKTLLLYFAKHHMPALYDPNASTSPEALQSLTLKVYEEVVKRTASLVAQWQAVGFVHGVLNTDNMSMLGLTIDYGPYGFMDFMNKSMVPNASDHNGRYSYSAQPKVCYWNLGKLAESLSFGAPAADMKRILERYHAWYEDAYYGNMARKTGVVCGDNGDEELRRVVDGLMHSMHETAADFTRVFRRLTDFNALADSPAVLVDAVLQECGSIENLREAKQPQYSAHQLVALKQHPELIIGLGLSESWIDQQLKYTEEFMSVSEWTSCDKARHDSELWTAWVEDYIRVLSGQNEKKSASLEADRRSVMLQSNPRVSLRNHLLQHAIERAEDEDYDELNRLLFVMQHPFTDHPELFDEHGYDRAPNGSTKRVVVSCSS